MPAEIPAGKPKRPSRSIPAAPTLRLPTLRHDDRERAERADAQYLAFAGPKQRGGAAAPKATPDPSQPKRIRRWAKRPTDPNHDANAFLSAWDVQILLRELEGYEKRIASLTGRTEPEGPTYAAERRRVRALIERLYAVKWIP